jgi:hypothetical protein
VAFGRLEIGGFVPEGHENIVKDVLGLGGVVEDTKGGGKERAGEAVVEFAERGLVTGGDALEDLCIHRVFFLIGRNDDVG